ncbi:hypothetical protein [Staphylococcus saprophyticus]|uniref:hypothetical protein n=1 Tax=Staphylococcus saprophyticus TaxID=29385 RepID=UPI00177C262A|nr:hypothetical protein [Staphylococcus saprophyticus]
MKEVSKLEGEGGEWLDDRGSKEWYRILGLVEELGIGSLDLGLVCGYCRGY